MIRTLDKNTTNVLNNSLVIVLLATLLLSISSRISFPIGVVPITAQTLAAYIIGFYLKPSESFSVGLSWMLLGVSGLPVFAPGFISPLTCPSFGYIIGMTLGMPLMRSSNNLFVSCAICYVVCSLFGCIWLYNFVHSWDLVFKFGIYPFILGECCKVAILLGIDKLGPKK
ncbi:MAG: biotin transporter BioY [Alphaproteobacteria bacterium]|nr:biotin transporter BioY [Alphaproteobacteria bacterium]